MDIQIRCRRWNFCGLALGPWDLVPIRAILGQDEQISYERRDGRPMGDLLVRCADQLSHCPGVLRQLADERLPSRKHPTTRMLRKGVASNPEAGEGEVQAENTGTSVFTVKRDQITDRINRLRSRPSQSQLQQAGPAGPDAAASQTATPHPISTPLPVAPGTARHAHLKPEQRDAVAAMAALREQQWKSMRTPLPSDSADALEFSPLNGLEHQPEAPVEKRTSSVFRYERHVVTDRIKQVKAQTGNVEDKPPAGSSETPPSLPPPAQP
jgi:hypothetical protein